MSELDVKGPDYPPELPPAWEVAQAASVDTIARWRRKPIDFVREVLGVEPDAWQADVLRDLEDLDFIGHVRIVTVASKGPGKSTLDAWVALWYLFTHPKAKGAATSITGDNLEDGLWAELAKWMKRSPLLQRVLSWTKGALTVVESPEDWFLSARTWPKDGSKEAQADTLAGLHADHCFFIIDEAGGVPSGVAAAADAGLANAEPGSGRTALLLVSGNPTHLEGPLYEACTTDAKRWRVHRVNGDPRNPKRSPRVSVEWAQGLIDKWGYNHPVVLVNVRGMFPPVQSNKLLGPEEVQTAMERIVLARDIAEEPKILGVDVARFGDDSSVATLRQGVACFSPWEWRNLSTVQLAQQAARLAVKHKVAMVCVDTSGIGGGVYDNMQLMDLGGALLVSVDFGAKALDEKDYVNHRTEIWVRMAEWVKERGCLPNHPQLRADLTAPTYSFAPNGKRQLETKKEMKARGVGSPDFGDSLACTFTLPFAPRQAPPKKADTDWHPTRRE